MLKYYSALTQVVILGFVCFFCPGMFNALNSMGGGGQVDDTTGTNANVALYTAFAVFGLLGGGVNNVLGPRITIFLGGLTYALYSGSFLHYNHTKQPAFTIASGGILGIGAGLLWAAQGSLMMAYPTEDRKGTYIAIFWIIFNLGGVLGGLIPFGLNYNSTAASVNDGTYIGFLVLQVFGAALAFALAPPARVIKEDGTHVTIEKEPNPLKEGLKVLKLFTNKWMLILTPAFFATNFFYTYQFNCINGVLFNVRTRGFNSVFYWAAQMLGAYAFGHLLDNRHYNRRKRGILGLVVVLFGFTAVWLGGLFLQLQYTRETPATALYNPHNTIDFKDASRFTGPFFLYLFYGMMDAVFQAYCYWLMGTLSNDATQLSRYAGYYKGVQSAGGAVAWRIDAVGTSFLAQFIANWALLTVSIPLMAPVVWNIKDTTESPTKGAVQGHAKEDSVYASDEKP
ncbi:hypothetical protein H4R33_004899 [Dimargaris cristalligena]|uniref:Major facilitator superfamily domain-containing protein n=1 Tax=Dimargaris cristalligena TaxID=215637 RepID=A0A4P9ZVM9_9FUNG|nr:hypothetical protein H4R33_004899 [Dimargaris cristalligena]RKP37664.1 major facilitator superfamily domain-containing protein [Dimargaris cristalligena]|eukprot:RKP37664.1 major facilitator superfamily domain-containing protein [Dimargaris cristalligena]